MLYTALVNCRLIHDCEFIVNDSMWIGFIFQAIEELTWHRYSLKTGIISLYLPGILAWVHG